jgi:hypothetical protein
VPKAKRKTTTAYATTADAELFRLHDKFCEAYAAVAYYKKAGGGGAGSVDGATKGEKVAQSKWERACDEATEASPCRYKCPSADAGGHADENPRRGLQPYVYEARDI